MKHVLRNSAIDMMRRNVLAMAILISKLFHASASWGRLRDSEEHVVHSSAMWIFRQVHSAEAPVGQNGASDQDILRDLNIISPSCMIKKTRLRFWGKIMNNPNHYVLQIAYADNNADSWRHAVMDDFKFIIGKGGHFHNMIGKSMAEWVNRVSGAYTKFPKKLTKSSLVIVHAAIYSGRNLLFHCPFMLVVSRVTIVANNLIRIELW